jgi:hypothetical protein
MDNALYPLLEIHRVEQSDLVEPEDVLEVPADQHVRVRHRRESILMHRIYIELLETHTVGGGEAEVPRCASFRAHLAPTP